MLKCSFSLFFWRFSQKKVTFHLFKGKTQLSAFLNWMSAITLLLKLNYSPGCLFEKIMLLCILIERWFTSSEYSTVCQSYIDTTFLIFCLWQQGVHWDMTTFCRLNLMTDWWFKILSMFYCIVGSGTPVHVELVPWNTHTDYATQV